MLVLAAETLKVVGSSTGEESIQSLVLYLARECKWETYHASRGRHPLLILLFLETQMCRLIPVLCLLQ